MHNVALKESRARYEEAYEIVTRAWSEEIFSYSGQFWSYKDVAIWPRPVQQPRRGSMQQSRERRRMRPNRS